MRQLRASLRLALRRKEGADQKNDRAVAQNEAGGRHALMSIKATSNRVFWRRCACHILG